MKACPICKGAVAPRGENKAFPFCGERCRLIDLGKWLTDGYRVPTAETPTTETTPPGHEDEIGDEER